MASRRWWAVASLILTILTLVVVLRVTARGHPTTMWVFAHPDDETLTSAGAMLDERQEGDHTVLLLTNGSNTSVVGDAGYPDTPSAVGQAREREARAALGIMEMYDVRFGGLQDGSVTVDAAERVIRDQLKGADTPVVVRGHSPLDAYGGFGECGHPDHCATAKALLRLYDDGAISDLRLYRIEQFFDGRPAGSCQLLDDQHQAFKQEMRRQYSYRNPDVGRFGIAARSVPGPWEATEVAPECFDTPRDVRRSSS